MMNTDRVVNMKLSLKPHHIERLERMFKVDLSEIDTVAGKLIASWGRKVIYDRLDELSTIQLGPGPAADD